MKLLVTGASGFIGRHVVAAALRHGHSVRAMMRPATNAAALPWHDHADVEIVRCDLRKPENLDAALAGVDGVIHLVAVTSGDFYAQFAGTVIATENLLAAMTDAGVNHIVLVSSFSVYDYRRLWTWSRVDEDTPLEARPEQRDDYCKTKLLQELDVRKHTEQHDWKLTVVRPGAVFGKDHVWTPRFGMALSPRRWLRLGAWARVPLTYVENCADAIAMCAGSEQAIGQTFNIVDDEMPTQRRIMSLVRRRTSPRPGLIRIPWTLARLTAGSAWLFNQLCCGGNARTPWFLDPARLQALGKPLRYSNRKLKEKVGWRPKVSLNEALDRSLEI